MKKWLIGVLLLISIVIVAKHFTGNDYSSAKQLADVGDYKGFYSEIKNALEKNDEDAKEIFTEYFLKAVDDENIEAVKYYLNQDTINNIDINFPKSFQIQFATAKILSKYDVKVNYQYNATKFFPANWLEKPISAKGSQLHDDNIYRSLLLISNFLSKYPLTVIKNNLKNIYLVKDLSFYNKSYGGTSSTKRQAIYFKSRKKTSNEFLLSIMHAEFSSILFNKNKFPEAEWQALNPKLFEYIGKGRYMLNQKNLYAQNDELLNKGFLVKYSRSSLENDFNMFADWLFTKPNELAELAKKHTVIKAKLNLAIKFYKSIDSRFVFESIK